jgi:hypothetical protein
LDESLLYGRMVLPTADFVTPDFFRSSVWRILLLRRLRLKTVRWICFAAALVCPVFLTGKLQAADTPVTPFLSSQTDAVIHADMTAIDMDAVLAWEQKLIASAPNKDPNQAQQQQQFEQQITNAKQWLADFKAAGGKDLYIVAQLTGIFRGQPGEVVVPLTADTKVDDLEKAFVPAGPEPEPADANPSAPPRRPVPATAVIGQNLIYSTSTMIDALKTFKPEARPDLTDALTSPNDAPIRVVFSPSTIKNLPFFRMRAAAPGGGQNAPFQDPQWDAVTWACISIIPPPTETGTALFQCRDADSATALATLFNQKITQMKADPQARKNLGDQLDKIAGAMKPTVDGSKVTVTLDQPTIDAMAKRMVANRTTRRPPPPQQLNKDNPGGPENPGNPGNPGGGGGF